MKTKILGREQPLPVTLGRGAPPKALKHNAKNLYLLFLRLSNIKTYKYIGKRIKAPKKAQKRLKTSKYIYRVKYNFSPLKDYNTILFVKILQTQ